jgi:endonuclease/exonuclease/phosphatase family metal-dependent hydrolase
MLLPGAGAGTAAVAKADRAYPITVMTRNVYLGADIQRPIAATAGLTGPAALLALGHATHQSRAIVDRTNFPRRSELLAAEIAAQKPDLVGLQEVALWRHGPLQLDQLGVPNAETVDYDFLATLLQDLREGGVPYRAVSVQNESDVESPSFLGSPFDGSASDASDVRLTMRDVILMKAAGGHLKAVGSGSGQYDARLTVPVAGLPMSFVRGYTWVDVREGERTLRFVNTHLEAFSSFLALTQAQQLLAGPAADPDRTTIIACDCNSDPLNGTGKPTDPTPHWAPYRFITGAAGFSDMWLQKQPAEPGFTSGLSETVDDATNAKIDHRIDMVFARVADGDRLSVVGGTVTGVAPEDKDPVTGLWPSDHGGVVLRLRGLAAED